MKHASDLGLPACHIFNELTTSYSYCDMSPRIADLHVPPNSNEHPDFNCTSVNAASGCGTVALTSRWTTLTADEDPVMRGEHDVRAVGVKIPSWA